MPLFVKAPAGLTWAGRFYDRGKEFPWKTLGIPFATAKIYFNDDILYHSEVLTVEQKVGDGLDALSVGELHDLVDKLNESVLKNAAGNSNKFKREKVKKSQIVNKQRGLIRSWRNNFGHLENI